MASSILSIGQSGLAAAQAGLNTTGHNIANAATPGYSRQTVIQSSTGGQNEGFGFLGKGTKVADVTRVYNDFLNLQVNTAQAAKSQLDIYFSQINQINNQFADSTSGLSPALQDFFKGVQDMASNPNATASRQSALSSAQALASRFQSLDGQLSEIRSGVNSQLGTTIDAINTYGKQISSLNIAIEALQTSNGSHPANDLLDQRDQVIADLSKQVGVSVVKQGNSFNVFIGSGQPLVVGGQVFNLVATTSTTDLGRTEVGYVTNGVVAALSETSLSGGALGGLFAFRTNTLDMAQNSLGRVAIGLATTFNAQHMLGQDQNGALGGNFFNAAAPLVNVGISNVGTAVASARISNVNNLTISDYSLRVTAGSVPGPAAYSITRMSDGVKTAFASFPQTIDGVDFNIGAGTQVTGDEFLIRPTVNGASEFSVVINDTRKLAAAAPVRTVPATTNTGTGAIGPAVVSSASVIPSRVLTFAAGNLTGFPPLLPVTVTTGLGVSTTYTAGTPVPWAGLPGDRLTFDGVEVSGIPAVAGAYTLGPPNATLSYSNTPTVTPNVRNAGTLAMGASIANPAALAASDYRIDFAAAGYTVTRLSDNTVVYPTNAAFPAGPIDGINFIAVGGAPAAGDSFLFQRSKLSGFPARLDVTVTPSGGGAPVTYLAGNPVSYTPGSTISYGGVSFTLSGTPNAGDTFSVVSNPGGVGDNRNALLLAGLQTTNTLGQGTASYQGAYADLVNLVGNKTREVQVNSDAEGALLTQARQSQQSVAGVNLDEEATALMRYQQAYQAAAKIMQTAGTLFDTVLGLVK